MEYSHTALRALRTANGTEHAEWVLLVVDLQRCLELVEHWKHLESVEDKTPRDRRLAESLFRDAVVSFVSCFDKDKGRVFLDEELLYGSIDGAPAAFRWFHDVRNQSIAHRYGPYRMAHTTVIVDEHDGGLLGAGTSTYTMYQPTTGVDVLASLIQVALQDANTRVEELRERCLAEIKAMHPSERRRLEVASYRVPDERSLRLGRRKYQNVNRQIRSEIDLPSRYAPQETRATILKLNASTEGGEHIRGGVEILGILEDDGTWCVIALELDLQGYGIDLESACIDLTAAIEAQLGFAINDKRGNPDLVFFATDRRYFEMFGEFRRAATLGQLRKLAEELKRMVEVAGTDSGSRPALKIEAIEESSATSDTADPD